LQARVEELEARLAELEARLGRNSGNSSQPPSADTPEERAQRPKPPRTGRKPGGQPGHRGVTRCTFPPELVEETHECYPQACDGCGAPLAAEPGPDDPAPLIHQVADLPEHIQLRVREYRLHGLTCGCCAARTWAVLPPGVPRGHWGPGVQALLALLVGYFHLSRRRAAEFLATLFGLAPCLGTLVKLEAATVAALGPVVQGAVGAVQQASVVHSDETGWRKPRDRPTLWVVVAGALAVFRIGRRDGAMFEALLPPGFARVVVSDRYAVYARVAAAWRQLCWAHLRRNFQALVDAGHPLGRAVGNWALAQIHELFHHWHRYQRGELTRTELQEALQPVQDAFQALLAMGGASTYKPARRLCRSLDTVWDALWTFAQREGVEPTNNAAERALRPAVLWRKGSFGHQSEEGRKFVETMLTVGGSLRLQGRPVLPFVRAACAAALAGAPAPSLLPSATAPPE